MSDHPTIGALIPTDPAKVLAKTAEKFCVPAGSVVIGDLIKLPPDAEPRAVVRISSADDSEAYRYLRRVFEHCAPQCVPLPDMLGLCTQIDNLIAGYRIDLGLMPDPSKASDAAD